MQCWQDLSQFQQFLQAMLSQAGPIPLKGVTDGSNAATGNIGEWLNGPAQVAYAAYPAITTQVVSPLVLSPGDWDVWAAMQTTGEFDTARFLMSYPYPAGFSGGLIGTFTAGNPAGVDFAYVVILSTVLRANVMVPTVIPMTVTIDLYGTAGLAAGTAYLNVYARRMR
jgi:hypothetical protein